jgi:hypothetical protein
VKTKLTRIFAVAAIALVAACVAAIPASAQSAYVGKFTLAQEATWGGANLPAGDYTFKLESLAMPARIVVTGPNGSQFVSTIATDRVNCDQSNLKIERRSAGRYVKEINLAELKLQLHYQGPKLPKSEQLAMGPASIETVLIAQAK